MEKEEGEGKMNDKILRPAQVLERFPVSKSSWYAGIESGR